MKLSVFAFFILGFFQPVRAYYDPYGFYSWADFWDKSSLVAVGTITGPPGGLFGFPVDRGGTNPGTQQFSFRIETKYKGAIGTNQVEFWDSVRSGHNTLLKSGEAYLIFLWNGNDDKESPKVRWAAPWNAETKAELEAAITQYQGYLKLTTRLDKISWLLALLEKPNKHLKGFVGREILLSRVTEAIPHLRQDLHAPTEAKRLRAAEMLVNLQDDQIANQLLQWLKDPTWEDRLGLVLALQKLKDPKLLPVFRSLVNDKDPVTAEQARYSLLQAGEPDGKALLFDVIAQSANSSRQKASRYNAIHHLHWGYQGSFSSAEVETLKSLLNDKDENVKRTAGFIVEKLSKK